jgi:hypothetical protein
MEDVGDCSNEICLKVAEVRVGSIATEMGYLGDVRFPPDSDQTADIAGGPFRANSGNGDLRSGNAGHRRPRGECAAAYLNSVAVNDGALVQSDH